MSTFGDSSTVNPRPAVIECADRAGPPARDQVNLTSPVDCGA
jgi:hypothetical protein